MNREKTNTARTLNVPPAGTTTKPGKQELIEKNKVIHAHEIVMAAWTSFCSWFSQRFKGVETTIERMEERDGEKHITECIDRPLEKVATEVLADGVTGIHVTVRYNGKRRVFEVAGPRWLRLHWNAAGWPQVLEIGYDEGKLALHFTGSICPGPVFTANSWGE